MGEFFKGWRRKAACILLIVAMALSSLWVRSQHWEERFIVAFSRQTAFVIEVFDGCLVSMVIWQDENAIETALKDPAIRYYNGPAPPPSYLFEQSSTFGWQTYALSDPPNPDDEPQDEWICGFGRFDFWESEPPTQHWRLLFMPFWPLVLPLTLLTAYLLLSKPRVARQKIASEN